MTDGAFARFRAGDDSAARDAVSEYSPFAYAAAYGVLRDAPSAEIVAANVMIEGLAGGEIPPGTPLVERVWVVATARAHALAAVRSNRRNPITRRRAAREAPRSPREGWLGEAIDVDLAYTAFENLHLNSRDALGLAYGSGLEPGALGRRLGLTGDEARDSLREALIDLETALTEHTP